MSIAIVTCRAQIGLHAPLVRVEVSLSSGLPVFSIVGLPATVVKESKDRVRAALVNSNFEFPAGRITVNLSPADLPKRGGRFDLPIALGILLASDQLKVDSTLTDDLSALELYGELGLSGELKATPGLLLAAAHAAQDRHQIIVPAANADEVRVLLSAVSGYRAGDKGSEASQRARAYDTRAAPVMRVAEHLLSVCAHLGGSEPLPILTPVPIQTLTPSVDVAFDLKDVRGQAQAKRALTVAAAGGHSILMIGPPGAGKSMLAMRLPGLLPPMTEAESLEVAAIASVSGAGFNAGHFGRRPMRMPHHTASAIALVGGGSRARPGEISLAHHGVLFLDELLEYDRRALESLREPLETGVVSIARASFHTQYPAQFQLVAAMNPCPCGRFGDPSGDCRCTPAQIAQYRGRVSAPLLERFDIHLDVPRVDLSDFDSSGVTGEPSSAVAGRVIRARELQLGRQGKCNARLIDAQIERICSPDPAGRAILDRAMSVLGFSARSRQRILKLARTIADLGGSEAVSAPHVSEAVTYRAFDRRAPTQLPPSGGSGAPARHEAAISPQTRGR